MRAAMAKVWVKTESTFRARTSPPWNMASPGSVMKSTSAVAIRMKAVSAGLMGDICVFWVRRDDGAVDAFFRPENGLAQGEGVKKGRFAPCPN